MKSQIMKEKRVSCSSDYNHQFGKSFKNVDLRQSNSIAKFYIRYDESVSGQKKNTAIKSPRYSLQPVQKQKQRNSQILIKRQIKSREKKQANQKIKGIPSYLRPTQSSARMERLRAESQIQLQNQQKSSVLSKLRSKSLEKQQIQPQKQYNRVPIEYYDQRDSKAGHQSVRGRIIFRGYQPKNTYFFLKALKPLKRMKRNLSSSTTQQAVTNSRNQYQIKFESKFQSGNLATAVRIASNQYWLYMREDTNTHGLRQWYYFMTVCKKPIRVKFRIYKFSKHYSLYRKGMKPFIRTCNSSNKFIPSQWQQGGQNIKYEYDSQLKCFYLQFQYQFQEENQQIQFSLLPPYTYSMMKQYVDSLVENLQEQYTNELIQHKQGEEQFIKNQKQQYPKIIQKNGYELKLSILGTSLAGLDIPLIQIANIQVKKTSLIHKKQAIIVIARTHPGETVSNFALENFIQRVLQIPTLFQRFTFFIIPMVNPDGVFIGNHRTSAMGQDLNRNFNSKDLEVFPQVQIIQRLIIRVKKCHKIQFLLDLHGHSARKNIFAYGDQHQIGSKAYLCSRILPKLISQQISSFKFEQCVFRESKQKKNTARVYFSNRYNINCITFQQSYGLLDIGQIGIQNWRNFGTALAQSIFQYTKFSGQNALTEYLSDQIQKQQKKLEQRINKHKKMLGIIDEQPHIKSNKKIDMEKSEVSQQKQSEKNKHINQHKDIGQQNQENILLEHANNNIDFIENQLYIPQQQQIQEQKQDSQEKKNENQSVKSSELSSGDQSLELKNQELEVIKKEVVRVGCLRQALKRQKYNIADAKLELFQKSSNNIHQVRHIESEQLTGVNKNFYGSKLTENKSTAIPRIVNLQKKKKEQYNSVIRRFDVEKSKELLSMLENTKLRDQRKMSIQQKFHRRVQLPSVNQHYAKK